jgi:nitrite reductase (cytochrome c-552)
MAFNMHKITVSGCLVLIAAMCFVACSPPEPKSRQTVSIPDGTVDPAVWGKPNPQEY